MRTAAGACRRAAALPAARAARRCSAAAPFAADGRECYLVKAEEGAEGVVMLRMDRPKRKNAFGRAMLTQFKECLDACRYTAAIRSVILTSAVDGVFSAGADLKERVDMTPVEAERFVNELRESFSLLEQLRCPTIAVVDGAALGGGLELALACDLRVCTAKSKLGVPETSLAIIPGAGGTQRLPRAIGIPRAKELVFTAQPISGTRAEEIGLVNYAAADGGAAMAKAVELSSAIARNGPVALRVAKLAVQEGAELSRQSGMLFEQQCYAQVLPTKDRIEGLAAFREKRRPQYTGA